MDLLIMDEEYLVNLLNQQMVNCKQHWNSKLVIGKKKKERRGGVILKVNKAERAKDKTAKICKQADVFSVTSPSHFLLVGPAISLLWAISRCLHGPAVTCSESRQPNKEVLNYKKLFATLQWEH